jgi:hypothetical protein
MAVPGWNQPGREEKRGALLAWERRLREVVG